MDNNSAATARLLEQVRAGDQAAMRLQEALNTLSAIDREVLSLRHFEEMTLAETALALGIEESAAANVMSARSSDSRRSSPPCPEDSTMSEKTPESSANYILLTRLADEFAARYRAGQRTPLQEYIDRYAELADDIRGKD